MPSSGRTIGGTAGPLPESPPGPSTLTALVASWLPRLRRWTHGRLPGWARSAVETSDIVQDVLLRTVRRLDRLEVRSRDALGAYLREAVRNRIQDEQRRCVRRGISKPIEEDVPDRRPSALDAAIAAEDEARYRAALARLRPGEQELIVAHLELGYTHAQLGCMVGRSSNAARMALRRAIERLAREMATR